MFKYNDELKRFRKIAADKNQTFRSVGNPGGHLYYAFFKRKTNVMSTETVITDAKTLYEWYKEWEV